MTTCGKTAYQTKRDAQTVINAIMTGHGRQNRPERLRAYPCPDCGAWHVTKGRNSRFDPLHGKTISPREQREQMRLEERSEVDF